LNNLILLGCVAIIFLGGSIFASQANAQYQPQSGTHSFQGQRTPVNGTYVNSNYGVQITLPDGWTGYEMKRASGTTSVMVAPGGLGMQGQRPTVTMMMSIEPKSSTPNPQYMSQRMLQNMTCNNDSTSTKIINGVNFTEVVVDCTGSMTTKAKYDIAQTNSSYVVIGFRANPSSNYDSQVATFDSAVSTLQIANTIEAPAIPEFPIPVIGIIVAIMVGTVVIFGRLKLIPGNV
jgi:hypothetical protein